MRIVHKTILNPRNNHPITICGANRIGESQFHALWLALKIMDQKIGYKLCATCWYLEVGNLQFDTEPSYGEELANLLNQNQEIIDVEEL